MGAGGKGRAMLRGVGLCEIVVAKRRTGGWVGWVRRALTGSMCWVGRTQAERGVETRGGQSPRSVPGGCNLPSFQTPPSLCRYIGFVPLWALPPHQPQPLRLP